MQRKSRDRQCNGRGEQCSDRVDQCKSRDEQCNGRDRQCKHRVEQCNDRVEQCNEFQKGVIMEAVLKMAFKWKMDCLKLVVFVRFYRFLTKNENMEVGCSG